jgi:hypothetical protein
VKKTPEQFVSECIEMHEKEDWDLFEDDRLLINQSFADKKDWSGLKSFYTKALNLALDISDVEHVLSCYFDNFKQDLFHSLKTADEKAQKDSSIKAIYYEYNPGTQNWNGDFFLCNRYSKDIESDWYSDFELENIIAGSEPKKAFFDFYEIGIEEYQEEIIRRYFDAILTASLGELLDDFSTVKPVAMAEHDFKVLHYNQ